jgi:regulatory protein
VCELDSTARKARSKCLNAAFSMLARREHSRFELQRKLKKHASCCDVDLSSLLDELETDNWLSDERFAEATVYSGIRRGQGPNKIRNTLRERGVASELVHQFLDCAEIDWKMLAREARQKRFGKNVPRDYREKARQSRFLTSRGFSSETIRNELFE